MAQRRCQEGCCFADPILPRPTTVLGNGLGILGKHGHLDGGPRALRPHLGSAKASLLATVVTRHNIATWAQQRPTKACLAATVAVHNRAPWSKQRRTNLALWLVFRGLVLRAGGSPFRAGLSCFNLLATLLGSVALVASEEVAFLLASTSASMALACNVLIVMSGYKVTPLVGCSLWPALSKTDLSCSGLSL